MVMERSFDEILVGAYPVPDYDESELEGIYIPTSQHLTLSMKFTAFTAVYSHFAHGLPKPLACSKSSNTRIAVHDTDSMQGEV